MRKYTNCPQCGIKLFSDYSGGVSCSMCGWGKAEDASSLTPPSGLLYFLQGKSKRWKLSAFAAVIIALLIITPVMGLLSNQFLASRAVAKARQQMDKRLYASAARTLNSAPNTPASGATKNEMKSLLTDTIRWARDISEVKTAKASIAKAQPEEALDTLEGIDEDFPQEEEAVELIDIAQEQTIDPSIEVNEEALDEVAFVPDDPEQDNLDDLTTEAEEQLAVTIPPDDTPAPQPQAQTAAPATPPQQPPDDTDTDTSIEEDPPIPEEEESLIPEEEEPISPEPDPDPQAPAAQQTPASRKSGLVPLYQMGWYNKLPVPTDQDSFYTIDLANEVTPKKDRKSNFGGYGNHLDIGKIYNRKQKGNKNIVPLWRYWSASKTDHYYTTNSKFSSKNKKANYVRQQAAGYIGKWDGSKCLEGTKPLYNLYSSKLTDNIYTPDPAVRDYLIKTFSLGSPKVVGCIW